MTQSSTGNSFTCPVCRKGFERSGIRLANDLERAMTTEIVICVDCHMQVSCALNALIPSYCHVKIYLTTYNSHIKVCQGTKPVDVTFKPVGHSSQPVPR